MTSQKKTNDEIDLIDLILIVWKKKWIVSLFIILSLVLSVTIINFKQPNQTIATTEIRPISVYDEAKYKVYNLFVNSITPEYLESSDSGETAQSTEVQQQVNKNQNIKLVNIIKDDLEINNLNKDFLFNLFLI